MPDWLWTLIIGGSGGGVFGYWLRARLDEHFAERKEARQFRQSDLRALRDDLLVFLGEPRGQFTWLQDVPDVKAAGAVRVPTRRHRSSPTGSTRTCPAFPRTVVGPCI